MELKKTPKADLEKMKTIFTEVGLAVALFAILMAFEWKSSGGLNADFARMDGVVMEEEMIPITQPEEIKPPPPPPPPVQVPDVLNIVDDDLEIDDNIDIFDSEFSEDAMVRIVDFSNDEDELDEEQIFVVVEKMPGFGGGDSNAFREYIARNLRYPEVAAENGIQGRVFVQFVVEADGRVSNVQVVRGVDPALDREAIRVVQGSPRWTPGEQRGKPVRVSFTFPIIFVLQ
jgi:periplasmic protein TonB